MHFLRQKAFSKTDAYIEIFHAKIPIEKLNINLFKLLRYDYSVRWGIIVLIVHDFIWVGSYLRP